MLEVRLGVMSFIVVCVSCLLQKEEPALLDFDPTVDSDADEDEGEDTAAVAVLKQKSSR